MDNFLSKAWNNLKDIFYVPTVQFEQPNTTRTENTINGLIDSPVIAKEVGGSRIMDENLSNFFAPIAIPRMKQDMAEWRKGITEMERPILPYRYIAQRTFLDTALDPHIAACIERRKNLTLLRNFKIMSSDNKTEYENWTNYFQKKWFKSDFLNHALDALFFGYSLISLGDIENDDFNHVITVRRGNISPDRYHVTAVPQIPTGLDFRKDPYKDFHIWIYTPNEHGMSNCGYGLYYILTPLAIRLKNLDIYNADYCMKFVQPIKQLKTPDKSESARQKKKDAMINMADSGWFISDNEDELILHQGNQGKGYAAYSDFRHQLHQLVSKYILGHADAMDSTTGKLGSAQGTKGIAGSPQEQSLNDIMARDGAFLIPFIEKELFNRLRNFKIKAEGQYLPYDAIFVWSNDKEKAEEESALNDENIKLANYLTSFNSMGFKIDKTLLEEKTGLKFEEVEPVKPAEDSKMVNFLDAYLRTNDPAFKTIKEKRENLEERLDAKKKPNHVEEAEWESYKKDMIDTRIDKEYELLSGDDKQAYLERQAALEIHRQEHTTPFTEDGDIMAHINCRCSIKDGIWLFNGEETPDALVCQNCLDSSEDYKDSLKEDEGE